MHFAPSSNIPILGSVFHSIHICMLLYSGTSSSSDDPTHQEQRCRPYKEMVFPQKSKSIKNLLIYIHYIRALNWRRRKKKTQTEERQRKGMRPYMNNSQQEKYMLESLIVCTSNCFNLYINYALQSGFSCLQNSGNEFGQ